MICSGTRRRLWGKGPSVTGLRASQGLAVSVAGTQGASAGRGAAAHACAFRKTTVRGRAGRGKEPVSRGPLQGCAHDPWRLSPATWGGRLGAPGPHIPISAGWMCTVLLL